MDIEKRPPEHADPIQTGTGWAVDLLLENVVVLSIAMVHAFILWEWHWETRRESWRYQDETYGSLFLVLLIAGYVIPGALVGWWRRGASLHFGRWLMVAVPYWLMVALLVLLEACFETWLALAPVAVLFGTLLFIGLAFQNPGGRASFGRRSSKGIDTPQSPDVPFGRDGAGKLRD